MHEILTELVSSLQTELKTRNWQDYSEVKDWLLAKRFKFLGQGLYSSAWKFPGASTIIKISYEEDECWLRFAEWAMKNRSQKNRNLPNIGWVRQYRETRGRLFFVALMEELVPFETSHIPHTRDLGALAVLNTEFPALMFNRNEIIARFVDEGLISENNNPRLQAKIIEDFAATDKGAQRFRILANLAIKISKCHEDLHGGNIMYRKSDRSIVIVDPSAGSIYFSNGF